MEIWKNIENFEGFYQVSNKGRVKSLNRKLADGRTWNERIMKTPLSAGYPSVSLRLNNVYLKERVHRLVGKAFVKDYKLGYIINHIDGNKLNNNHTNLEWCTHKHNVNHAFSTGLNNALDKMHETNQKKTVQLDLKNNLIKIYDSAKEAAKAVNCPIQNITRVCRGGRNSARGFKWCYLTDYENRKNK
jgi:hypothetical protein